MPMHTSILSLLHWTSSPDQEDVCDINRSIRKELEYYCFRTQRGNILYKENINSLVVCGITYVAMQCQNVTK